MSSPYGTAYRTAVPRLWNETIDAHRHAVREAALDAAAALVAEHGPLSVTMSAIAERTGVGRATLYKYFPDVESILAAWHERQISAHLAQLIEVRDRTAPPDRLAAVLERYAHLSRHAHGEPGTDFAATLDQGHRRARHQLRDLLTELVRSGTETGDLRDDVPPDELATYCVHALTAASVGASDAAVRRLVQVTLSGLQPPNSP